MDLKVDILLKKQATMSFRQESRCASNGKQREPHLLLCTHRAHISGRSNATNCRG